MFTGRVSVRVFGTAACRSIRLAARGLRNVEAIGRSDPFVIISRRQVWERAGTSPGTGLVYLCACSAPVTRLRAPS